MRGGWERGEDRQGEGSDNESTAFHVLHCFTHTNLLLLNFIGQLL